MSGRVIDPKGSEKMRMNEYVGGWVDEVLDRREKCGMGRLALFYALNKAAASLGSNGCSSSIDRMRVVAFDERGRTEHTNSFGWLRSKIIISVAANTLYFITSIPDDTRAVVAHRLYHISKLILGFCDIQRRETQRDRHEQRRVSELLARADTPTEAEG